MSIGSKVYLMDSITWWTNISLTSCKLHESLPGISHITLFVLCKTYITAIVTMQDTPKRFSSSYGKNQ